VPEAAQREEGEDEGGPEGGVGKADEEDVPPHPGTPQKKAGWMGQAQPSPRQQEESRHHPHVEPGDGQEVGGPGPGERLPDGGREPFLPGQDQRLHQPPLLGKKLTQPELNPPAPTTQFPPARSGTFEGRDGLDAKIPGAEGILRLPPPAAAPAPPEPDPGPGGDRAGRLTLKRLGSFPREDEPQGPCTPPWRISVRLDLAPTLHQTARQPPLDLEGGVFYEVISAVLRSILGPAVGEERSGQEGQNQGEAGSVGAGG